MNRAVYLTVCMLSLSACSPPEADWNPFPNGHDRRLERAADIPTAFPWKETEDSPLVVTAELGKEDPSAQSSGAWLTARNASKKAIILLRLEPFTNAGEETLLLSIHGAGRDGFNRDGTEYECSRLAASINKTSTHSGLLLPGESLTFFHQDYMPVASTETFVATFVHTQAPYAPDGKALLPWGVLSCAEVDLLTSTRYRPLDHRRWLERPRGEAAKSLDPSEIPLWSTAVMYSPPKEAHWIKFDVAFNAESLRQRDEARTQIADSLKCKPEDLSFCHSDVLGGYLVREQGRTLFFQDDRLSQRPEVLIPFPPSMLKHAVSYKEPGALQLNIQGTESRYRNAPPEVELPDPPVVGSLWNRYPVQAYKGKSGNIEQEYLVIAEKDLLEFLRLATKMDAHVEMPVCWYGAVGQPGITQSTYELCGATP